MGDEVVGPVPGAEAVYSRICVSWAQWTHVPANLPASDFEIKRGELNAAIERARLKARAYFGKATE